MRDGESASEIRALHLLGDTARLRANLNFGLVLTRLGLAGLAIGILMELNLPSQTWVLVGSLLVTGWLLFLFEWLVERTVSAAPDLWAVRLGIFAQVVKFIFSIGTALPLAVVGRGRQPAEAPATVTEDDLKTLLNAGEEEGLLEREEGRMIDSIFRLGETLAREVMIPRIDMVALEISTPIEEAVNVMLSYGHSRVPVYEGTIDQMRGLLYIKDLLGFYRDGEKPSSLQDLLRPAFYIPEAKHLDSLLAEMQAQRIHMAIVVDEYGGVAGAVTLEDIVEEIVGEIQDEYDQEEESPFIETGDGGFSFQGRVDLDDFNEVMGSGLSKEEADTIGGYIYSRLGHVPAIAETVQQDNLLLTVEQVTARRIRRVHARWVSPDKDVDNEKAVGSERGNGKAD